MRNDLTGTDFKQLLLVIRGVDERYLNAYYAKQKAELKQRGNRSRKSR